MAAASRGDSAGPPPKSPRSSPARPNASTSGRFTAPCTGSMSWRVTATDRTHAAYCSCPAVNPYAATGSTSGSLTPRGMRRPYGALTTPVKKTQCWSTHPLGWIGGQMRIAVIGGGPGGLYFSALAQQLAATTGQRHEITVWERNAADDTFGFGVVFSDETLGGIEHADPVVFAQMQREFAIWDDIDVHVRGEVVTSGGHAFAAMSRRRLLEILQERCRGLGVDLRFRTDAPPVDELAATYDLVVAADGLNSAVRHRYADTFRPSLDVRDCRYIWLGTDLVFDAFKFFVRDTPHGVMQIHGYPFDATGSTFIVEMTSEVWRRAGFEDFADRDWAPGESDEKSIALIRELFDDILGGYEVMANNSRWISFTTVRNEHWVHAEPGQGAVVILGDAAHTAHFSIGSGTKLAMEDALALAACLHEEPSVEDALTTYEEERKAVVLSTQRAAQASLEWFENLAQYVHQDPTQFGFNIMTRSRRVTYDNLRVRDPEYVARCEAWFASSVQPAGATHR